MKITETRKDIIELISNYMDKTLSEGCLVEVNGKYKIVTGIYAEDYIGIGDIVIKKEKIKIIGHYDITAVFKYIKNNANNDRIGEVYKTKVVYDFENNVVDILGLETKDYTWRLLKQIKLPAKPLHLYTEQEEKNLLELLLKIKICKTQ